MPSIRPKSIRPTRRAAMQRITTLRARDAIMASLADLKEDVALNTWETQAVHERLDKLEPTLATLERERQRRIGVVKFITDVRVWFVFILGGLAWAYHNFVGDVPPPPPHAGS